MQLLITWGPCAHCVQVLQVYAPLAHALGLDPVSAKMEDASLALFFRTAYAEERAWAEQQRGQWQAQLAAMQAELSDALHASSGLRQLGVVADITARAKSASSIMKKQLSLTGAGALLWLPGSVCLSSLNLSELAT